MKEFRKYFTLGVLLTTPLVVATQVFAYVRGEGTQQACCGSPDCFGAANQAQCNDRCDDHCTSGSPLYQYCMGYCLANPTTTSQTPEIPD